jgi:SP family arabinose:H+ symporter-like MFS transporter
MKSKENVGYVFFLSIVAAFGGFLFGYDTAVVSGTMDIVEKQFSLTPIMKGWFGSCAIIGSIIGALSAGVISDYFGRKKVMLMSAIIFVVSGIGCAVCSTFGELVLWRVVGGIGIGVVSVVSPIYISEISITKYRGLLVSLYQLSITVGILASYGVNYLLDDYAKTGMIENALMNKVFIGEVWRGMLGMESAPALLFMIVVLFIPESPRWLIVKSKLTQAGGILRKIYNAEEDVQTQIHDIEAMANKKTKSDFSALFQPGIRFAVIIGVCIAILGQFMGVNAVIYYGPTMFATANVPCPPLLAQVLVGIVNTLATILAMFIIDRIGRKKLIYFGVSGMIVSLILIAAYYITAAQSFAIVVYFMLYIFFQAVSISAVVWVLLSEMYPTRVRGMAMSIASFALWVANFVVVLIVPALFAAISPAGLFIIFAVMCIPYMLIMWKLVPETAGMSLEDIERYWISGRKAKQQ